ncbi:MAG: hypothetical protein Q4D26_01245 [Clostridia bacterium]|nr:hypothetical protein [Clostridia bacterium]
MKKYSKPEMEIAALNNSDKILLSGGVNVAQFNKNGKDYTGINF